jgi:HPt (histidine-containing phosphotransfer) domain-containing protein
VSALRGSDTIGEVTPVDMAHLARYTLGDAALEREVFELFCTQSVSYLDQLRAATSHKAWYQAAHALKGSARAVGAWRLARAAEYIEVPREDSRPGLRATQLQELEASTQEAAAPAATLSDAGRK